MMERQKWVDHKFNLGIDIGWTTNVLARVLDTEIRLKHHTHPFSETELALRLNDQWSIKEHIGHLSDLEPLWINRFTQFEEGTKELVHADMSNAKTEEATHNEQPIATLLSNFKKSRHSLVQCFNNLSKETLVREAFHPRLKTMMKPVDLLFFIAEHDDHHISTIRELVEQLNKDKS